MDRWVDTLSEDWPSQPPSECSDSIKQSPSAQGNSSPITNASQSRIPRYKYRSTSAQGPKDAAISRKMISGSSAKSLKNGLSEMTSSTLNASHQQPANGRSNLRSPNPGTRLQGKRHNSTGLQPTDTVQHKLSPLKHENIHATPEWKRRVLKGNIGPGEQADLFGPIGLENIFRSPTINSKALPKQRKGRKVEVASVEDYPSSPPQYPSAVRTAPRAESGDLERMQSISMVQMDILEEGGRSLKPIIGVTDKKRSAEASGSIQSGSIVVHSRVPRIQSEDRDEQISEIYTHPNTVDGCIHYAAIDGSMRRLHSQMDKLRLQQQNFPGSRSSDDGISYAETGAQEDSLLPGSQRSDITSHSLPEDLSTSTEVFASNGGFINVRRGGYSNEGSFRRRALSPSSLPDFDDSRLRSPTTPERSNGRRYEKSNMSRKTSPKQSRQPPRTPKQYNVGSASSPEQPRSSGSPLKLFDKYDTFTNDRLVRRMSKFEETLQQSPTDDSATQRISGAFSPRRKSRKIKLSQHQQRKDAETPQPLSGRRVSSFGQGELDNHHFPAPQNSKVKTQRGPDANKENRPKRSTPHDSNFRFDRPENPTPVRDNVTPSQSTGRVTSKHLTSHVKPSPKHDSQGSNDGLAHDRGQTQGLEEVDCNAQGKRLPYSPAKDPQPKRRRTLHEQEEADTGALFIDQPTRSKESLLKSTLGRKRKDALYDGSSQLADPRILATRQMLRPRTPTPSQTISQGNTQVANSEYTYESRIEIQNNAHLRELGQDLRAQMDPPPKVLVDELASFTLDLYQGTATGARKASVTTADFFNEAQQIMRLLREQGRPRSQMSAQELEFNRNVILEEASLQESTKDEFSRPPSRDGGSLRRLREPQRLDARVISHLRKFEEKDDVGVALSSSLKTLQVDRSKNEPKVPTPDNHTQGHSSGIESDPPNIRIINQSDQTQKQKHSSSSLQDLPALGAEIKVQSYSSQSTSGSSTGRSVPTGSSHDSGKRAVIAPETVSHLLSDHVAGMTFDHAKRIWVKRKSSNDSSGQTHNHTSSEIAEDDPFGDVPDLSVDELEELARTKQGVSAAVLVLSNSNQISQRDYATQAESHVDVPNGLQDLPDLRPHTADGQELGPAEPSSAPSYPTRFASSVIVAETRATSWVDEALQHEQEVANPTTKKLATTEPRDTHAEEVEHEISILEGRVSQSPKRHNVKQRQARVITVAFSSPLIDQTQPQNDWSEQWEEESELNLGDSPACSKSQRDMPASKTRTSSSFRRRSVRRNASRRLSLSSQSYIARPMSRLDEEDELPFLRDSADARNMSIVVSTPLHRSAALRPPDTDQQLSIGFHLSPLPDFTVHQLDRSFNLDLDHVAKRRGLLAEHEVEGTFSLATQELVKKLTDIEPYEPYWDYIRKVDLQKRGLLTLHGLHEYCGRIEELDVSDNELEQLNGAPPTLRSLKIGRNCLSSLTAWGHLHNLQYLDVSGNQIQSFMGFYSLVHLRELKADDNDIESLDGIFELDGLISLRLRRNRVGGVDFEGSNL